VLTIGDCVIDGRLASPQIVGRTDYDLVDRKSADSFRENDRMAMAADKPRANEEWLTFAETGYRGLFETIKTPMRDNKGNVIGVLGIARDVTARKRAERAAKMSRTRLRVTMDATQIGIWDWDLKRDRWYASSIYFTQLGYKQTVPDRAAWLERVHPDDLAKVRAAIDSAMPGSTDSYGYEARIRHADGTYRWMSIRGKVVQRDSRGAGIRMLGVRMDINEQKRAEEKLRHLAHFDALSVGFNCGVGVDLMRPAVEGREMSDAPAYAETLYPEREFGWAPLHALRTARFKLIDAPHAELYDLAADAKETTNRLREQASAYRAYVDHAGAISAGFTA